MGFKWPELTHDLDCAGIGYPGVTVTLVLNPTPLPKDQVFSGENGDTKYYHRQLQIIQRVFVPGEYREDGEDWEVVFDSPESLWKLDAKAEDFDSRILYYAGSRFYQLRTEELPTARKN